MFFFDTHVACWHYAQPLPVPTANSVPTQKVYYGVSPAKGLNTPSYLFGTIHLTDKTIVSPWRFGLPCN